MILLRHAKKIYTLAGAQEKKARHSQIEDLSPIENAAILIHRGRILWVGPEAKIPKKYFSKIKKEYSVKNKVVLPGLIECHTHSVFAGNRSAEFELRNQGVSYQEIAARGGGILSTRAAIRSSTEAELIKVTQSRVQKFIQQGVTTLEIKSGYGLDLDGEIKSLNVIKKLTGVDCIPTFLGAHAIPKEFESSQKYLEYLKAEVLPVVKRKRLADRVDIFIESGFFSKSQASDYLKYCQSLGFEISIHADQLTLSGGADLAVQLGARSADHVIQVGPTQIKKLSKSSVTAVLLPMADLYMKCAYPPARALIDAGARVALATDFNPGTCPSQDITMVGLLARLEMKMSLPEIIVAYTLGAAFALGLESSEGSLVPGRSAKLICVEDDINSMFYSSTETPVTHRFYAEKLEKIGK